MDSLKLKLEQNRENGRKEAEEQKKAEEERKRLEIRIQQTTQKAEKVKMEREGILKIIATLVLKLKQKEESLERETESKGESMNKKGNCKSSWRRS